MRTIFKYLLLCYILSCWVPFSYHSLKKLVTYFLTYNLKKISPVHTITPSSQYKFFPFITCIGGLMTWMINIMVVSIAKQFKREIDLYA